MKCVKNLRGSVGSLLVLACIGSVGCSSDSGGSSGDKTANSGGTGGGAGMHMMLSCDISRCPNELSVFDDKSQCDAIWNGPCAKEYKAYQKCYLDNEQCGPDGRSTVESTTVCDSLTNALGDCTSTH